MITLSKPGLRVMVTGSRDWTDDETIRRTLGLVQSEHVTIIHGGCDGADQMAARYARELGWEVVPYLAEWFKYGVQAGPIRNAEMIASRPDIVIAFPMPGCKGTMDAMRKAFAARVDIIVTWPKE